MRGLVRTADPGENSFRDGWVLACPNAVFAFHSFANHKSDAMKGVGMIVHHIGEAGGDAIHKTLGGVLLVAPPFSD